MLPKTPGLKKVLIACLLLVVCILYFHDILKGAVLFTERDLAIFFIPPRKMWSDMLKAGRIPLWNPYFSCGQPLLAALQPGILYPFNILLLLFPFDYAFNLIIILHFFLAGFFTYLLLKTYEVSDTGALIGGMIFMLSGYLLSVHNLLIHLLSVVWLPLVLISYHQYCKKRHMRHLLYAAIFLAMMFLAGAIEILYATFILLLMLMFFPDPLGIGVSPPPLKKRGRGLLVILFLFILLSAVQFFPFIEMVFHSIRAEGLSYKEAVTWSLDLKDLLQFFLPDLYGYTHTTQRYWQNQSWLKTIYLGIIPFLLFLFFLMEKKRSALPLILIMESSLLLALGGNTPVYRFLFLYVPFFNTFRYPVKFLFIFIFFLSVGAGIGYDSLCRQIRNRNMASQRIIQGILAFSVCTVCAWSLICFHQDSVQAVMAAKGIAPPLYNFPLINVHNIKRFLLFCSLSGPVLVFGWRHIRMHKPFSIALLSLLIIDLFFANKGFYHTYDAEKYHEPSETVRIMHKDESLFRVATTPEAQKTSLKHTKIFSDPIQVDKEKLTPGFNMEHHIHSIHGAEVIRLGNFEKIHSLFMSSPNPDSTNLLALLNVKHLISKSQINSEELELEAIVGERDDPEAGLRIYRNLRCLPRAFLVKDYQVIQSEREYKEIMQSKAFDPGSLVLMDKAPSWERSPDGKGGTGEVAKVSAKDMIEKEACVISLYQPNRIILSTCSQSQTILFLSDAYYPGWKAYIDGEKGEILRADFAFRAVPLTPGYHRVEFVYRPLSVIFGALVTSITIVAIIGAIMLLWVKGVPSPPNPHTINEGIPNEAVHHHACLQ